MSRFDDFIRHLRIFFSGTESLAKFRRHSRKLHHKVTFRCGLFFSLSLSLSLSLSVCLWVDALKKTHRCCFLEYTDGA